MGARHSKRSVDISGGGKEADEAQPLDGKLEKLDEGPKMVVNGASHSEHKAEEHDEQVSNGDPISLPEQVAEEAGPSSPSDEVQPETAVSEVIQPPKKKEKVKKKWSLRSLSFSKKDKSKPGKDDLAKDDTEGVLEVSEEKVEEGGASFLSSVTETISNATEAVSDAVVSTEHKVEEGLTATQDQVEKISAKVAEKAEALVVKMEAMTVQAVDAVQNIISSGHTTATEVAVPDAGVTNDKLPEIEVTTAVLPEAPKIELTLPEVTEVVQALSEEVESKVVTPIATNVTVPEPAVALSSVLPEAVMPTEQAASDVLSLKAGLTDLLSETIASEVVNEQDIPAINEVEVSVQEMPPPLPASPPPSAVIGEVVAEVINMAVKLGETKDVETMDPQPSVSKPLSPITAHVPTPLLEAGPSQDTGGGGDEPRQSSGTSVVAEVVNQVIQTAEQSLASHLANQVQENARNEQEVDAENEQLTQEESSTSDSGTNLTTEDHTGPPPGKPAEE